MTAPKLYDKGDLVRVFGVFKDINGAAQDPTTVSLEVTKPDGTVSTITYNPGLVTRTGVGLFQADVDANLVGEWRYKWIAQGAGQATESHSFFVKNGG